MPRPALIDSRLRLAAVLVFAGIVGCIVGCDQGHLESKRAAADGGSHNAGSGGAGARDAAGVSGRDVNDASVRDADSSPRADASSGDERDATTSTPASDAALLTDASVALDPYTSDRDAFFGASRCSQAALLFCDGFEQSTMDSSHWQKAGSGSAVIDATQAARGQQSLHVQTTGNGFAYLRLSSIFPVQDNRYYARMFVRFDALPVAPMWAHWTIAEAQGTGDGSLIRVGGQWDGSDNRFGVGSDNGPTGDWTWLDQDPQDQVRAAPEDQWVCIEWLHDGQAQTTRLYWDGVEHPSLTTLSNQHGGEDVPYVLPAFESVWIGFWLYQANPSPAAYDVWIDEVAFDDERIGCVR